MKDAENVVHNCAAIDDEDEGFWVATCACGWVTPPVPDVDDAVDCMMDHAAYMATSQQPL